MNKDAKWWKEYRAKRGEALREYDKARKRKKRAEKSKVPDEEVKEYLRDLK